MPNQSLQPFHICTGHLMACAQLNTTGEEPGISLVSDPTLKEGKGFGDIGAFSWYCTPSHEWTGANTSLCK